MTPDETIKAIGNLIRDVKSIGPKAELFAANEMYGTLSVRVFNQNKNTDGRSLGKYKSESWKSKRKLAGRQTDTRDLNFTGNLFLSFKVGKDNGRDVVGFTDGVSKSLNNYNPKQDSSFKRKSKAKKQTLRNRKLRSDASRSKPKKSRKPVEYPGTAKLSELIEENLDMVIFTPNKSEVNQVIIKTNKFALSELDRMVNKHLR